MTLASLYNGEIERYLTAPFPKGDRRLSVLITSLFGFGDKSHYCELFVNPETMDGFTCACGFEYLSGEWMGGKHLIPYDNYHDAPVAAFALRARLAEWGWCTEDLLVYPGYGKGVHEEPLKEGKYEISASKPIMLQGDGEARRVYWQYGSVDDQCAITCRLALRIFQEHYMDQSLAPVWPWLQRRTQ